MDHSPAARPERDDTPLPATEPGTRGRRRILIIYYRPSLWSMGPGSGATSFTRTPTALAQRGHDVHVVLPEGERHPDEERGMPGVRFHRYRTRWWFVPRLGPIPVRLWSRASKYLAFQIIGTRRAMEVARRIRPDLVIGYGPFEAPVARRVATRLGIPNVTRLFGNNLGMVLGDPIRTRLAFPDLIAFKTPCQRLILTNDGSDGDEVARSCGVPPERFVHLRNGLNFELFTPGPPDPAVRERLGMAPDAPLLITVTRLAHEKKLERVIDAMPALLARRKDAVAVLLGDGEERERLEAHARALGVMDSMRFPGPVPGPQLPSWYRSADVVLSMLDRTNASNPVFEAMACKRCVVGLDVGTTREVILAEKTGVLLPREDLPRLGDVLADVLDDPERRRRLGEAARDHIRSLLLDPPDRMEQEVRILLQAIDEWEAAQSRP